MLPLKSLGKRIVVLGPSNAGKSTLAVSIGQKLGLSTVHLDQLRHLPNTNWTERTDAEFESLHNTAIMKDNWVIEGNYTGLLPQRLDRATGVILLHSNVWLRYFRYVKRTLRPNQHRAGQLEGGQDRLSWKMTYWILIKTRNKDTRYAALLQSSGKTNVECHSAQELNALYDNWKLPPLLR